MPVKILTVHYDPARGIFEDEVIAEFIQNKRIIEMTPQFFMLNGKPHWTLYINYEIDLPDVVRNTDGLSHDEQLLLKRLTEWRTETAEEIKMPPFIIASNKQLVSIVKQKPQTNESLKMVHGFGSKKVQKYGKSITNIIRSFFEKEVTFPTEPTPHKTRKKSKTTKTAKAEKPASEKPAPEKPAPEKSEPVKVAEPDEKPSETPKKEPEK